MLEVCVDTIQAALIAEEAGADRVELCSALDLGGVTPSGPLVTAVRRSIQLPLVVLIRSRAGNFLYDKRECELMIEEAKQAIELGADGIAIGGLVETMDLHLTFLRSIAKALPKSQLVMHRAFDRVREPLDGLESLIELGFKRILTSGGPDMAIDGVSCLRRLIGIAKGRIEILPAGGVAPSNALEILAKSQATQLHGSFRVPTLGCSTSLMPCKIAIERTKSILASLEFRESRP